MKMKIYFNYRMSFIIAIVAICILTIFTVASLSFYSASSTLRNYITNSYIHRATDHAQIITEQINAFKRSVEGVTMRNEVQSMNMDIQRSILQSECERLNVSRFQVVDLNGVAESTNRKSFDISDRDHFKRALKGETVLTDPINSRINGELVVICSTPIRNENHQIVGVLTGALTSDFLFRIINSKEHSFIEYSYLINKGGTVIAHPNQDLVISRKNFIYDEDTKLNELSMIHKKMIKGETGYGFYWYEESEKFVVYTSISDTGWSLALVVPKNKIFSEIDALKRRYISTITILITVVSLLSIFIFLYVRQKQKAVLLQENVDLNAKLLHESIELDRIKTDNFVNISHELRTPINVILATIQMLNQYSLSTLPIDKQNLTRHIKSMKKNCLRLIRLVNNLIDTTKIESGYIEINIGNYNIVSIVEELTMSVADYFKGKGICLEFDTDIEEKIIACDIDKIERIILNLLSNAVKFTKEEGSISVRMVDKYDSIIISVKDNGIGIPSDKKEYIFKRFRQIDKSLTRNHEGSGVGLFLVKSLVEMHGGTITVESELNKGSEFIIELPAKTVSNDNNERSDEYVLDKNHYIESVNTEFSDIYF